MVQSYLIRKGHQLKNLLANAVFMSFALLTLGSIARLKFNVDQIESKLRALDRIVGELKKRKSKE